MPTRWMLTGRTAASFGIPISKFPENPEISHTKWASKHLLWYQPKKYGARKGGVWLGVGEAAQGSLVSGFLWQPRFEPWRRPGQDLESRSEAACGTSDISHCSSPRQTKLHLHSWVTECRIKSQRHHLSHWIQLFLKLTLSLHFWVIWVKPLPLISA